MLCHVCYVILICVSVDHVSSIILLCMLCVQCFRYHPNGRFYVSKAGPKCPKIIGIITVSNEYMSKVLVQDEGIRPLFRI